MLSKPSANTTSDLRGDYTRAGADYVVDQEWLDYSSEQHETWQILYERQINLLPGYACEEFIAGMNALNCQGGIPRFEEASEILRAATGWEIVAVPGFVPEAVFFEHLANRRFPATRWIRERNELDYLVEPDLFHDFFGHVPLLSNPVFADYLEAYGKRGKEAQRHGGAHMLARLYWYMVEFGLIETPNGLRAYGAGMLSSSSETVYSVENTRPNRIRFDLERVMRTDYLIDDFQKTYFVLESFDDLFKKTAATNFVDIYDRRKDEPGLDPRCIILGEDEALHVGGDAIQKARIA